jgi:hypothetical protein
MATKLMRLPKIVGRPPNGEATDKRESPWGATPFGKSRSLLSSQCLLRLHPQRGTAQNGAYLSENSTKRTLQQSLAA